MISISRLADGVCVVCDFSWCECFFKVLSKNICFFLVAFSPFTSQSSDGWNIIWRFFPILATFQRELYESLDVSRDWRKVANDSFFIFWMSSLVSLGAFLNAALRIGSLDFSHVRRALLLVRTSCNTSVGLVAGSGVAFWAASCRMEVIILTASSMSPADFETDKEFAGIYRFSKSPPVCVSVCKLLPR